MRNKSAEQTKEPPMTLTTTNLDSALGRIAAILQETSPAPFSADAAPTPTPGGTSPNGDLQKADLARWMYHWMNIPLITREKLVEMQAGLPAVVEMLANLNATPTIRNELQQWVAAAQQRPRSERSEGDSQAMDFMKTISREAFGEENERFVQVATAAAAVGAAAAVATVGIAAFTASYTVAKNWRV
jgi:hypothetical protein